MFYPSLVIAILAAIVASQTMITATFQVRVAHPTLFGRLTMPRSCVVVVTNNQTVVLPTDKGETHIEGLSRSDIHSVGQLASHGWYDLRHSGIQQCKYQFVREVHTIIPTQSS